MYLHTNLWRMSDKTSLSFFPIAATMNFSSLIISNKWIQSHPSGVLHQFGHHCIYLNYRHPCFNAAWLSLPHMVHSQFLMLHSYIYPESMHFMHAWKKIIYKWWHAVIQQNCSVTNYEWYVTVYEWQTDVQTDTSLVELWRLLHGYWLTKNHSLASSLLCCWTVSCQWHVLVILCSDWQFDDI